eukprot:121570_1
MHSTLKITKPQTNNKLPNTNNGRFVGRKSSPVLLTPGYGRGETPLWNTFESMEFDFDIDELSDDSDDEMKGFNTFSDLSFDVDSLDIIKETKAKPSTRASVPPSALLNIGSHMSKTESNAMHPPLQTTHSELPPSPKTDTLMPAKIPLVPSSSVPMKKTKHYHMNTITIWSNFEEELNELTTRSRKGSMRKQIKFKGSNVDDDKDEDDCDVRKYLIGEIIQTEESYVKGLNTLLYEFVIPMFDQKLIKRKYKETITCNIPEILLFHGQFLKQLVDTKGSLVSVFYKLCNDEFVSMYTRFVREYHNMLDVYAKYNESKKLQNYLKAKRKEKKPLTNHLILPIQRVTRYLLLLQELKKETPYTHSEYHELECVLDKINQTVSAINTRQGEIENMSQCLQVQETMSGLDRNIVESHRKLLAQFVFRKKAKQRRRHFFLFNDLMIITNLKMKVKALMEMRTIEIKKVEDNACEFDVYSLHHKAVYQTDDEQDLDDLAEMIEECRVQIHQEQLRSIGAEDMASLLSGVQSVSGCSLKMHKSQSELVINPLYNHSSKRSSDSSIEYVDIDYM